jgi:hypothetical protein
MLAMTPAASWPPISMPPRSALRAQAQGQTVPRLRMGGASLPLSRHQAHCGPRACAVQEEEEAFLSAPVFFALVVALDHCFLSYDALRLGDRPWMVHLTVVTNVVLFVFGWQMHLIRPFSYLLPIPANATLSRMHNYERVLLAVMAGVCFLRAPTSVVDFWCQRYDFYSKIWQPNVARRSHRRPW